MPSPASGDEERLGAEELESSFAEHDFVVLAEEKLTAKQQCSLVAQEARSPPGWRWEEHCQQVSEGDHALFSALVRPRGESCLQWRAFQRKKDMALEDRVECEATKRLKGLEHPSCEEKLRELGGFSARKQGRAGEMSSMCLNPRWEDCIPPPRERGQGTQPLLMGAHGQGKGKWRKGKRRAISLEEKASLFPCEGGEAVEPLAQGGVAVPVLRDPENLTAHGRGQHARADSAQVESCMMSRGSLRTQGFCWLCFWLL